MYLSDFPWPNAHEDLSRLKPYSFTPKVKEYSCPTCFCRLFCEIQPDGRLTAFIGALDNVPGLLAFHENIFIGDTIDGGAGPWTRLSPDGTPAACWREHPEENEDASLDWLKNAKSPGSAATEKSKSDVTPLWCHCRGVKLFVRSGADLLSLPSERLPWFVDGKTGKYQAVLDGCDSCIKTTGADTMYWTFAPVDHISSTDAPTGEPEFRTHADLIDAIEAKDPRVGTLAVYRSSDRARRLHCSKCAAVVFFAGDEKPDQVDIAMGVLDHPNGARAEGLCYWNLSQVDFAEDGKGGWREDVYRSHVEQAAAWQKGNA